VANTYFTGIGPRSIGSGPGCRRGGPRRVLQQQFL